MSGIRSSTSAPNPTRPQPCHRDYFRNLLSAARAAHPGSQRRERHPPADEARERFGLDDCFGDFLVRVVCECGACREITPQALARLVGWKITLKQLALRMRCSQCGKKAATVEAVARPRPRGIPKNPH
jgi:hypothetical protein